MKQKVQAEVLFDNGFNGELLLKEGSVPIGTGANQTSPYRMLQGALISCFHSTFLDIINKKRVTYEQVRYVTNGEKRDEVLATLEVLHIDIYIKNASNQVAVEKSYLLATKVCSIYQTLSHVAEMSYAIHFE